MHQNRPQRLILFAIALGLLAQRVFYSPALACERCEKWGEFYKETTSAMAEMKSAMTKADEGLVGDPDQDFIALMTPHHQAAIDMAKAVLLHGKDPALKNLAQGIIAEQSIEIAYLQKIQARLEPKAAPLPSDVALSSPRSDYRFVSNEDSAKKEKPASAPGHPPDRSQDRIYTGDQVSNTVSVIDPATDQLVGLIKLGEVPPAALAPLYKGQSLVHGLGFSPDGSRLCVVSIGSNAITLIDTATNKVLKSRYVGRAPHEAFFTPDGKQIYVAVRGEDYVLVLDSGSLEETTRIQTNPGPAMILFRPDGKFAFVPSSFTAELCVIECATQKVVARVMQASPFSPNLAVSADGKQVWFTLKDSGKTQVMSAEPPFAILETILSGPITNHVATVDNQMGHFAYVTVGGLDQVKVYRREAPFEQVATIPTGALPHGIWAAPDGGRVYIGLENESKVQVIDTTSNKITATIPVGQLPQALVYVPGAARVKEGGSENLVPLSTLKMSTVYQLRPKDETQSSRASVTVISLGLIDQLQIAASGLAPGQEYTLRASEMKAKGQPYDLVKVKASPAGTAIANTLGPVRKVLAADESAKDLQDSWRLSLDPTDPKSGPQLLQK